MSESSRRRDFSAGRSGKKAASRKVQAKLTLQRDQQDRTGRKSKAKLRRQAQGNS